MAPTKSLVNENRQTTNAVIGVRKGITTRNQKSLANHVGNVDVKQQAIITRETRIKRKADTSPVKGKTIKRSALGNITNAIAKPFGVNLQDPKKAVAKKSQIPSKAVPITKTVTSITTRASQIVTRATKVSKKDDEIIKPVDVVPAPAPPPPTRHITTRRSAGLIELEKSNDSSLYVNDKIIKPIDKNDNVTEPETTNASSVIPGQLTVQKLDGTPKRKLPDGVQHDFDAENWRDPYQVSQYAMEIFEYLKSRESLFPIGDYMEKQVCLSTWMRSLLVDWMVEVQESFELNHETLYLAVKLVDLYLTKVTVGKETLQLLGAASLFIASKFDERIPPMVEDFLYICDGAYSQHELIRMEMNVLKVVDFDLGIPLSYRFLRRYARCVKVSMPTLTLARYILEYSLMDYTTISFSDSKIASAALLLALQMKDLGDWTPTLEYYTGYKIQDIRPIVLALNEGLHKKQKDALATVRNKYSHK
ncbi:hypothetical protein HCN44_011257 [Aphidius gifuensis]|uniref:G2/mitotic-specific cyclin-B3 n=1 Tax=Aphidius gifuensis TaxID=684658 RepID=A0A834XV09_APHGI|nr:hypothetical protein HCN44_011257 [Aphidius gifuensis]